MSKHKTAPTEINPEVVDTLKVLGEYIHQYGLDSPSYVGKGDATRLSKAIAKNPDILKEYKKTAKEAVDKDRNWGVYKNVGGEKKPESNTANPYQKGIGDFFDLPPDTDEKNGEKGSKLEYIIDGAKKVATAAPPVIMGTLYLASQVGADLLPAAAAETPITIDSNNDDNDHHSPTDPANYNVKDDISNFMEGLSDKIQEYSPIPVAAAAEDTPDNPKQGKPDLVVKSIDVTDYDEETAKYKISCTIKNEGNATAPKGFFVEVYDDTGNKEEGKYFRNVLTSSDLLDLHSVDEDLKPGDEYTIPVEKEINHNLFRPIKVCVDAQVNKVDESREDNNELTYEVKQQSSSGKKPDLIVEKAWIKKVGKGEYVSSCTIKNIGDAPSPGNFIVERTEKEGSELDSAGILLPSETYTTSIGSIMTLEETQKCTYVVDCYGEIDEKDEGNNELKLSDPRVEIREGESEIADAPRQTDGQSHDTGTTGYLSKAVTILGASGLTGGIAYYLNKKRKKRKGPANKPRHSKPKPDKRVYEQSDKQEPPPLKDKTHSVGGTMHSVGDNLYLIGKQIGGKMQHSYDSLKQKIGERYETHRNKGNEGKPPRDTYTEKTKDIGEIKKVVSGLKHRTTRKQKSKKTKQRISDTNGAAALKEPNLDGLKKMLDANYGALGYTAYTSEEAKNEGGDIITIVPNMHLTKKEEEMLGEHLEGTGPGYKYKIVKRELKSPGH